MLHRLVEGFHQDGFGADAVEAHKVLRHFARPVRFQLERAAADRRQPDDSEDALFKVVVGAIVNDTIEIEH